MPERLEISFNSPQCGWMSIGFRDQEHEFHTTTAHSPYENALPELMQILTETLDPSSQRNEWILHWNRDPEAFDFHFRREDNLLTLKIFQFPTDERKEAERELVFSHCGPIREVANAFAATFDQLYEDRNTDEFEFNWRRPFPLREYEQFKEKIATTQLYGT
jgi:hypothetical protein